MPEFYVGQRVRFEDPESFDSRIGKGYEARGRVAYIDTLGGDLLQIIPDGKTFAVWINANEVKAEGIMNIVKGDLKVQWNWIGEGLNGDYNPGDPKDRPVLRFYCFRKLDNSWEEIELTSFSTRVQRNSAVEQIKHFTEPIFTVLEEELGPDQLVANHRLEDRLRKLSDGMVT